LLSTSSPTLHRLGILLHLGDVDHLASGWALTISIGSERALLVAGDNDRAALWLPSG
jgi:hypothetical protein